MLENLLDDPQKILLTISNVAVHGGCVTAYVLIKLLRARGKLFSQTCEYIQRKGLSGLL